MKMLLAAGAGRLEEGTRLGPEASQSLAQAALHIMAVSMDNLDDQSLCVAERFAGAAREQADPLRGKVCWEDGASGTPECVTHLRRAMDLAQNVARYLPQESAGAFANLRQMLQEALRSFQIMTDCGSNDALVKRITAFGQRLPSYRNKYFDYGLINMQALASAHLQRHGIRAEIPVDKEIEDPAVLIQALMKRSHDHRYLAESYAEEGLHLLSCFEEQAARARTASAWAEVLNVAHQSLFWVTAAKTAFDWSETRYARAGCAVPADLLKERQVVEEYRVEIIQLLLHRGGSFIFGPIIALGEAMLRHKISGGPEPKLINAVNDWAARTPIYPERLRKVWLGIAGEEERTGSNTPVSRLIDRIAQEFPKVFTDRAVACASLLTTDLFSGFDRHDCESNQK
ncbi:MAG: hypothetical protein M0036_24675 [Desulfobacteraceae bacterium]|nr:hypothetical protein [Desulfobacteraceae bacterium]